MVLQGHAFTSTQVPQPVAAPFREVRPKRFLFPAYCSRQKVLQLAAELGVDVKACPCKTIVRYTGIMYSRRSSQPQTRDWIWDLR